ncbi:efflux RND transporter periplasmic adaptor subunit [Kordiimonas lacus]|uniref:RND family efflux transporter, MFP subunit n=1 Tax=Kordiimonas lacus TaxID=637679 RepID=A0A1G6YCJ2_9PROT|nr:efflux RND transporter periplasmic adaptor subunit [Kordiimonas lacus]SDD87315.1 RND family efflux transporter, MFP subunit [Kordiimonas lacus]
MRTLLNIRIAAPLMLVAGLLAAAPASGQGMGEMPPAQVEVVEAASRKMAPQMDVSGTVISLHDSRISAEVEGPLLWVADVGTAVEEGDVIARIDDRLLAVALRRAAANVKRLQADLAYRQEEVKRYKELAAGNNASQARLDEAIANLEMARQEIADAQAVLDRAQGDVDRTQIKAAFPGHVVQRLANKGEYVTVGEEVLRLVDTRNIEIAMPAPIDITPYLTVGTNVEVKSKHGIYNLPIRTVVPVGDAVSRMVEVRLSADAKDWTVSTPVMISLPKGPEMTAVAVPRDALIIKSGSVYLFKVGADGTAQRVDANIKATVGLWVALADGVEAGDKIVVRGGERLQPGQPVVATAHSSALTANN